MLMLLAQIALAGAPVNATTVNATTVSGFTGTLGATYTPVAGFQTTSDDLLSFRIACKSGGCIVQKLMSSGKYEQVTTVSKVTRTREGSFIFSLTPKDALPSDVMWKPSASLLKTIEWTWVEWG